MWQPEAVALFDIHVTDIDAQSCLQCVAKDVLATAEKEEQCVDACEE